MVCEGLDLVKPGASTTLCFSGHKPKSSLISLSHLELSICPFQIKSLGVGIVFYLKNHLRKKQLHRLVRVRSPQRVLGCFWEQGWVGDSLCPYDLNFLTVRVYFLLKKFNHLHTNYVTYIKNNRNSSLTYLNRFIYFLIILCHFKELEKYQNILKKKS